jgi:hypothetical protein
VNQVIESPPLNFVEPDVVAPVIVNGDQSALRLENFGILSIGVQNLMLSYHGMEENEDEVMENPAEDNSENEEMENASNGDLPLPAAQDDLAMVVGDNEQADMEYFHFNDLVQLEVAHLQLGKVETFSFLWRKLTGRSWWCGVDVGVLYITAQLETPREGYNEHSRKSSLSCETKVYQTSRRNNQTSEGRCPLALQQPRTMAPGNLSKV